MLVPPTLQMKLKKFRQHDSSTSGNGDSITLCCWSLHIAISTYSQADTCKTPLMQRGFQQSPACDLGNFVPCTDLGTKEGLTGHLTSSATRCAASQRAWMLDVPDQDA